MPQISGRELAERLARVRPKLKVLFMSGYTDDEVLKHGAFQPGTALLQKPFVPDALVHKGPGDAGCAGQGVASISSNPNTETDREPCAESS